MRDLLVTGTSVGVGKTVVTAGLILAAKQRGLRPVGWKPVDTGADAHGATDAEVLAVAAGIDSPLLAPLLKMSERVVTSLPKSPSSRACDPAQVHDRLGALRGQGLFVIVEDAGGLLLPLARGLTALDLAAAAGLDVVIVTGPGIADLDHALLAARVLVARRVPLRALVVNGAAGRRATVDRTNVDALRQLLPQASVVALARQTMGTPLAAARSVATALLPLVPPA